MSSKTLWHNIPEASSFFCGKYLCEYNQYLKRPVASGYFSFSEWIATPDTYFSIEDVELYDHIHFLETDSPTPPSLSSFDNAPYAFGDFIAVPMSEGIRYTHLIEHNCLHQYHGDPNDILTLGPFWIDNSPPYGSISIASGLMQIKVPEVDLRVDGTDTYSGISGVFIDGNVIDGPNVRQWIPYDGTIPIELSGVIGRRIVRLRFMDYVGNESSAVLDDIFLGTPKYFFFPTTTKYAHMDPDIHQLSPQDLFMKVNFPSFREGTDNGILHSS